MFCLFIFNAKMFLACCARKMGHFDVVDYGLLSFDKGVGWGVYEIRNMWAYFYFEVRFIIVILHCIMGIDCGYGYGINYGFNCECWLVFGSEVHF